MSKKAQQLGRNEVDFSITTGHCDCVVLHIDLKFHPFSNHLSKFVRNQT